MVVHFWNNCYTSFPVLYSELCTADHSKEKNLRLAKAKFREGNKNHLFSLG